MADKKSISIQEQKKIAAIAAQGAKDAEQAMQRLLSITTAIKANLLTLEDLDKKDFKNFEKLETTLSKFSNTSGKWKKIVGDTTKLTKSELKIAIKRLELHTNAQKILEDTLEVTEEILDSNEEINDLSEKFNKNLLKEFDLLKGLNSQFDTIDASISKNLNNQIKFNSSFDDLTSNLDQYLDLMRSSDIPNVFNELFPESDFDHIKAEYNNFIDGLKSSEFDINGKIIMDADEAQLEFNNFLNTSKEGLTSKFNSAVETFAGHFGMELELAQKYIDQLKFDNMGIDMKILSNEEKEKVDEFMQSLPAMGNTSQRTFKMLSADLIEIADKIYTANTTMETFASSANTLKSSIPLLESVKDVVEDIGYDLEGIVNSVLPGWARKILNVEGSFNILKSNAKKVLSDIGDEIAQGKSPAEAITNAFKSFPKNITAGLGPLMKIGLVLGGIVLAAKALWGLMTMAENSAKKYSETLGVSRQQGLQLHKNTLDIVSAANNKLATEEDVTKILASHVEKYGTILDTSKKSIQESIKFAASLGKTFGIGSEKAYELMDTFQKMGADVEQSKGLSAWLAQASELAGVSFAEVTKDLVESTEEVALYFKGMPKEAAKAAVQIKKLGMSLKQIGQIMEKSLDISGFYQDMTELTIMTQGSADLGKFFEMRFSGASPDKLAKEIADQYDNMVASGQDNEFNLRKFAELTGQSVAELQKGAKIRKELNGLSQEQQDLLQNHLGSLSDADLANSASAAAAAEKLATQDKMNVAMDKFKAVLQKALLPLAESLSSLFEGIVPILNVIGGVFKLILTILKPIFWLVEGLLQPFILIGKGLSAIVDKLSSGKDEVSAWETPLKWIKNTVVFIGATISTIWALGKAATFFKFVGSGFGNIVSGAKGIGSAITGAFSQDGLVNKLKDGIKGAFSQGGIVDKFKDGVKGAISNPGSLMDKAKSGVKSLFSSKPKEGDAPDVAGSVTGEVDTTGLDKLIEASKNIDGELGNTLSDFLKKVAEGMSALADGDVTAGSNNIKLAEPGISNLANSSDAIESLIELDAEQLKDSLEKLAEGLQAMGEGNVRKGSLNLIPAAVGFGIMNIGVRGARKLADLDGERLKTALKGMAEGLGAMGTGKVIAGSIAMVIASVGFVAFIPGTLGARLIQNIDGEALKTSLQGLASGLSSMGTVKVIAGALAMVIASIGFIAMIPGAIGMVAFGLAAPFAAAGFAVLTPALIAFGTAMMTGVGAIGLAAFLISILALAVALRIAGPGITAFGTVIEKFGVALKSVFEGLSNLITAVIGSIGGLITTLSELNPLQLVGAAIGITAMAGALALFGLALASFGGKATITMLALAEALRIAAPGISSFGTVIEKFGGVLKTVFEGLVNIITAVTDSVIRLVTAFSELDPLQLAGAAIGITSIAGALALFGGGSAIAGIGSAIGNLFGGDPIKKLIVLAKLADPLKLAADSIERVASSLENLSSVLGNIDLSKLKDLSKNMFALMPLMLMAKMGPMFNKDEAAKTEKLPVKDASTLNPVVNETKSTSLAIKTASDEVENGKVAALTQTAESNQPNNKSMASADTISSADTKAILNALVNVANRPVIVQIGDMELKTLNKKFKGMNNNV